MSKRIKFMADYDHQVRTSVVAYKAGQELSVPDAHAEAAIAAKKAHLVAPMVSASPALPPKVS